MNQASASAAHVPFLDGWRGLAILAVLCCHFGNRAYASIGAFGVTMFFVLSGYFMCQLLFIKSVPFTEFMARRFSRIVPTCWLFTLVMWMYARWFQPVPYDAPPSELVATLVFLRTYFPADLSIWADRWPIGHLWSLNVEEHSYLFLACLALYLRTTGTTRRASMCLLSATALAFATTLTYGAVAPPAGASPWHARSETAALGLLAAAAFRLVRWRSNRPWVNAVPGWLTLVAIGLAALCYNSAIAPKGCDKLIGPVLLAFSICYLDRAPAWCHQFLSMAVLRWFGRCSFSLYLWQHPFFMAVEYGGMHPALGLAGALLVGTASYYLFETPTRSWINTHINARYRPVPVAG